MVVFAGVLMSLNMSIEPSGIEEVATMCTLSAAVGYYYVLVSLVRNRFDVFERIHTGKEG